MRDATFIFMKTSYHKNVNSLLIDPGSTQMQAKLRVADSKMYLGERKGQDFSFQKRRKSSAYLYF